MTHKTLQAAIFLSMMVHSSSSLAWKRETITIFTSAPPAAMTVVDAMGRRNGADPDVPLSPVGEGKELQEMPFSEGYQENIGSDEPATEGQPSKTTGWFVHVFDGGTQSYRVELRGMAIGISEVRVGAGFRQELNLPRFAMQRVKTLVTPGAFRQFQVIYDPDQRILATTRIVKVENLPEDIGTACTLGMVSPSGVCQSLKAKADAATAALQRGEKKAATGSLRALLNELKAQGSKHVMEPALTILREEAGILLQQAESTHLGAKPGKH